MPYQETLRQLLTFAGKALAIAGPNPFQSAATPSAAMSLRAQSMKPEYVPCGALCSLDLMVCQGLRQSLARRILAAR